MQNASTGCTRPPGGYRGPPGWGYTGGGPAVQARVGTGKAHALREAAILREKYFIINRWGEGGSKKWEKRFNLWT